MMQRILLMIPLSLSLTLTLGLSACEGAEPSETPRAAAPAELVPTAPGTLAGEGATIVASQATLEVRVEGSKHALIVSPSAGELSMSWDGQLVDPEAELPVEIAAAFSLVQRALADEALVRHLFAGEPGLVSLFARPIFKACQVTGCSGQICASEPVFTTCEWRPEYECLALTQCGPYGEGWSCAWEQTPEYLDCLAGGGGIGDGDGGLEEGDEGGGELCGCVNDSDCVKTVAGCCPCNAGGQEIAVAAQCLDDVPGCDSKPGEVMCLQVYLCTDSEAVCEAGQCVLTGGGSLY